MKKLYITLGVILCLAICGSGGAQDIAPSAQLAQDGIAPPPVHEDMHEGRNAPKSATVTPNHMADMIAAATVGDYEAGQAAERLRSEKIDAMGLDYVKVAFDDLYLLAKITKLEAGNCPHDECPLGIGEIVLNRVASPEWDMPNTIEEVLKAPYQYYYPHMASTFENAQPDERCLRLALRLLEGERHLEPSVIFHDNWGGHGGGAHSSYQHDGHGRLYFCYSGNREVYE